MNGWKNWQTFEFFNWEGDTLREQVEEVYSENPDMTYEDVIDLIDAYIAEMMVYRAEGFFGSVIDDAMNEVDFHEVAEAIYNEVKGD